MCYSGNYRKSLHSGSAPRHSKRQVCPNDDGTFGADRRQGYRSRPLILAGWGKGFEGVRRITRPKVFRECPPPPPPFSQRYSVFFPESRCSRNVNCFLVKSLSIKSSSCSPGSIPVGQKAMRIYQTRSKNNGNTTQICGKAPQYTTSPNCPKVSMV